MEHRVYSRRAWRELPRDECVIALLFGELVGPCSGTIHRHHVIPTDEDSPSVETCASHHPLLHKAIRQFDRRPKRKRCPHVHRYPGAREACEARMNAAA